MWPTPPSTQCFLGTLAALVFACPALGARFYTEDVLPANITATCKTALLQDVASCSKGVTALVAGYFYPKTELEAVCTSGCTSSLATYHGGVVSACVGQIWDGSAGDLKEPVAMISEMLRYHYNFTCLSDGTRFCNNVAAAYSVFLDPDGAAQPGGAPAGGAYGGYVVSNPCDDCLVRQLRFQAGSPYYLGLDLQSSSAYQSLTSSCSVTGAPLTTTPLSIFTPTTSPTATPTCAGQTYAIQAGDTCHSISTSQGIGTDWLLTDNGLTTNCRQFPTSGNLCLVNKCQVYTVAQGDTCASIARTKNITEAQLRAWNPSIDAGCYHLNSTVGDQLCVNRPGSQPYTSPALTTIGAPTNPTTPAPVPTDKADQTNSYCGRYYKVVLGEYCNLITMKFGISLADFRFLNPAINENCTNLFAEESYCVQPVGDLNTYTGKPGHVTFTLTTSAVTFTDGATNLPPVSWSSPTATTTDLPLATGSRTDCETYLKGDTFRKGYAGNIVVGSDCGFAAAVFDVTLEDLGVWNPSLGNTTDPSCTFEAGKQYCGKWYEGERPDTGGGTVNLPTRDGMTPNCTDTVYVGSAGVPTCQDILTDYGLTIAQFFAWNPSVGADCGGMWAGYLYCVRTNQTQPTSTTTTGTSTTTTTSRPTPPAPTQEGQPANCVQWHVAASGDDCGVVETRYSITHAQFLAWNPAVSADCVNGFWGGFAYCIAVSPTSTTATTTTSSPTSTNTNSPPSPAPTPNQAGNAISSCNKYGQAQSGDWCALFADRHGVTLANLYTWNSVLGADGAGCSNMFWADYWYCIGVAT